MYCFYNFELFGQFPAFNCGLAHNLSIMGIMGSVLGIIGTLLDHFFSYWDVKLGIKINPTFHNYIV